MAIVKMQKLSVVAGKKHRKAILEALQSMGAMEIFTDQIASDGLEKMDTVKSSASFAKMADSFDQALKLLSFYAPEMKTGIAALVGHKDVPRSRFDDIVDHKDEYVREASDILQNEKQLNECQGTIQKDENQITSLQPWMAYDIPMGMRETKSTDIIYGTVPGSVTEADLFAFATKDLDTDAVSVSVLSAASEQSCVAVICLKRDAEKVEENLREHGFARPAQTIVKTPAEEVEALKRDIEKQKVEIREHKKAIASYADQREAFKVASDYFRMRAEKYKVLGTIPQSKHVFFLEGWVTADTADQIAKLLTDKFDALVEKEEIREDDFEPTVLKNNRFSQSVEGILESYGLPTKGHVDPTFIMSFFYVFFFGMMLSDAGYGILMFLVCGILLLKYKKIEPGLKRMLQLFFWCGISTTFWGAMYGGFFGNAIDTIATTFFGWKGGTIVKPLWFEPLTQPMRLLVWCMLFGLIHLFTGLGIKGFEDLQQHDVEGFVSDVISWYMFVLGLVLILLPSSLFESISGMTFNFPPVVVTIGKWMAIIGAVIILIMSGRGHKNWAIRIALGAYDLYGITSWLSDVLSYSRLLALGLATGVIANVINLMASMFGGGVLGAILFIVIFILGHTLNIGINALGAYVHTNRLQYVEFFGKFYEAGGRPFRPFKTSNKYIEIKEER